jgi:hypothetical protein
MQIAYAEFELKAIIDLHATGLKVKPGDRIIKTESFIDVMQGKVLYRVFIEQAGEDEAKPLIVLPDGKN